uniref:Gustatory receptor n=1 Tax=Anopheles stephensi TaxID=30069 RepID=A0A182YRF0_ANOST
MARFEFLSTMLYIKMVLVGVFPFRFHKSTLKLDCNNPLLCYSLVVAVAGPSVRFGIYVTVFLKAYTNINVVFLYAVFMAFVDLIIFIVPSCYLLWQRYSVKQAYDLLVKLYQFPLLVDMFPIELWFRRCLFYNLMYETVHGVNMLLNVLLRTSVSDPDYYYMMPWAILSLLTKSAVSTIMYGSVQYVILLVVQFQELLQAVNNSSGPVQQEMLRQMHHGTGGYMEFYDHLWKASEMLNDLFGVPLLAYLSGALVHATSMYYILCSRMLMSWNFFSSNMLLLGGLEFVLANLEVMYLMKIVDTCGQIQKEKELRVSTFLVVYSIVLALGCTASYQGTQFLMSDARYLNGFKETYVNKAISAVQGQVVLQTFLSAVVRRYQKRYEIAHLIRQLFQLKKELFNTTELTQRWTKWRILRKITISQVIVTSSFVLAVRQVLMLGEENMIIDLLALCIFYYPKVNVICSVSLYYAVMMFLQNLHFALNERLKQLVLEHANGPTGGGGYVRTQHSVYIRSKLNYLADARYRIVACCTKTHELYQQMLLSCNFLCMTYIISQILYLHYRTQSDLSFIALGHEALTCLLCYFEVFCIAEACELVREQSIKTQKLLLRLNLNPMDHKLKQSQHRLLYSFQIEVFALQTLHQPLEFTACRMFTLDYTVLFSIAASVTNYLIILIQFEMAIGQ